MSSTKGMGGSESKNAQPSAQESYQQQEGADRRESNVRGASSAIAGECNSVTGGTNSYYGGESQYSAAYSVGTTGGWIAEIDAKILASGLIPTGYSTAPSAPEGTKGCEPCVNPPKNPTGMKLFQAMRKEWRTKTEEPPPPFTIDDVDPDDIADAIEDTPGDILEPAVHLPVMLDILIDIWEDSGLYD